MVFQKEFFEKIDFEKNQQAHDKKAWKVTTVSYCILQLLKEN